MNNVDRQYIELIEKILKHGKRKTTRNDDGTLSVFGHTMRFDLREGFPILTTKKIHFKSIVHELLWMISGSTNIRYLVENNVRIWSDWPHAVYQAEQKKQLQSYDLFAEELSYSYPDLTLKEFEERIKSDEAFANRWGSIGSGGYGNLFRNFCGYDQIRNTFVNLKNSPFSRRHVISLWNPSLLKDSVLPPCHHCHVYNCEEMTTQERRDYMWRNKEKYEDTSLEPDYLEDEDMDDLKVPKIRLNLSLFQRSADSALGVPFNIAQYALLLSLFANALNYDVGELMWTGVDVHLYSNQIEPIKEQLSRTGHNLPILKLNPSVRDVTDYSFDDIELVGYTADPSIKIDVTV